MQYLKYESKTGKFLDIKGDASAPHEDFGLCLSLDRFNFVLKVEPYKENLLLLRKVELMSGEKGVGYDVTRTS